LFLRLIQGICLGGEYAAPSRTSPNMRRRETRLLHGWLQTSPTLGIVVSLAVIAATRELLGADAFNAWVGGFHSCCRC